MLSLKVGATLTLSFTVGAQLCASFGPADDWGQNTIIGKLYFKSIKNE